MIDGKGTIYEGRCLEFTGSYVGVTGEGEGDRRSPNFGAVGIVLFGHFSAVEPSSDQVEALYGLLDGLSKRYGISPDCVIGHGELPKMLMARGLSGTPTETVCPGEHLQAVVGRWRAGRRVTPR